jgi:hypothetical protein
VYFDLTNRAKAGINGLPFGIVGSALALLLFTYSISWHLSLFAATGGVLAGKPAAP